MAFVITITAGGLTVKITTYSINPAQVYIVSKENHGLGNSSFMGDYPYYVDKYSKPAGEFIQSKTYTAGNYAAILYGSDDALPFHILDYSYFVLQAALSLKAVEFGKFWADNLNDDMLKTIAKVGILNMADTLSPDPVQRLNSMAYVLFTPSPVKFQEAGILAGLTKIAAALFSWVKANPGKAALLLASFAYVSIRVIDWGTKNIEKEIAISQDSTLAGIANNPDLTAEQKIAAMLAYINKNAGTDWGMIAVGVAAILGLAYVLGGRR